MYIRVYIGVHTHGDTHVPFSHPCGSPRHRVHSEGLPHRDHSPPRTVFDREVFGRCHCYPTRSGRPDSEVGSGPTTLLRRSLRLALDSHVVTRLRFDPGFSPNTTGRPTQPGPGRSQRGRFEYTGIGARADATRDVEGEEGVKEGVGGGVPVVRVVDQPQRSFRPPPRPSSVFSSTPVTPSEAAPTLLVVIGLPTQGSRRGRSHHPPRPLVPPLH